MEHCGSEEVGGLSEPVSKQTKDRKCKDCLKDSNFKLSRFTISSQGRERALFLL